ncbi:MAG: DNA repair protein RecN [Bdellovibrionaceae bacterium]|nr:DNA repair protein RecN [Pseudobdellovibrionaceae bacterium]
MLVELRVKNFALIDELNIQFKKGFNVLSGETGSGKSILLKSLAVLMGAPSSNDFVGPFGDTAQVEGLFDVSERPDIKERLNEMDLMDGDDLIVRRQLGKKSRVYINGSMITLTELKNIITPILEIAGPFSAPLMEMTGQHDTKQLLSTHYHRFLLDLFGGVQKHLEEYRVGFEHRNKLIQETEELKSKAHERHHQLDFLKYQIQELDQFNFDPEADGDLKERISRLKNKQKLIDFLASADYVLNQSSESVLSGIHKILKTSEVFGDSYEKINASMENLQTAKAIIEDVSFELSNFESHAFSDEDNLDALTERYTKLRSLQKKFGESIEEFMNAHAKLKTEIETLESLDDILANKEAELKTLETKLQMKASQMHELRLLAAKNIEVKVNEQLQDLNMKGVLFFVGLERSGELNRYGSSKVEFLVKTHSESELRPLAKTASGGELSRILLSIKSVLGENEWPRTYLFDEVDTGVSGPTAELVGKKLKTLAFDQQILCVTHLPQVAALGDHHYAIEKLVRQDKTQIKVRELNKNERVTEIARLMSGEHISESSRQHAQKLLGY